MSTLASDELRRLLWADTMVVRSGDVFLPVHPQALARLLGVGRRDAERHGAQILEQRKAELLNEPDKPGQTRTGFPVTT